MPGFNVDSPFIGPNGLANFKQYGKAILTALNKWRKDDNDPPLDFLGPADFYQRTELDPILDDLGTQPTEYFEYEFQGDLTASSDFRWLTNDYDVLFAQAVAVIAGSGSAITLQWQYKGTNVLTTPLSIPAGATGVVTSAAIALPTLVASGFDIDRRLTCQCVSPDSGDTAQFVHAALLCRRRSLT